MADLVFSGLTKRYGEKKGVFDLSLSVQRGEAFGFIGPNGAGKTTAIRHLLGFLNPDSGGCQVRGLDCRKQAKEAHALLGYLPGEIAFFDHMKGDEFLKFCMGLRGQAIPARQKNLLERFELDPRAEVRKMSKGMKQKLGLVAAFQHAPDILVLDEPTSGLDPLMQQRFTELVREEKQQGKTFLISSHSFEEIEKTCSRVGILKHGRLVADEDLKDLQATRRRVYAVSFPDAEALRAFLVEDVEHLGHSGLRAEVAVTGAIAPLLQALARHRVLALDVLTQGLEDVFMQYYKEGIHE